MIAGQHLWENQQNIMDLLKEKMYTGSTNPPLTDPYAEIFLRAMTMESDLTLLKQEHWDENNIILKNIYFKIDISIEFIQNKIIGSLLYFIYTILLKRFLKLSL